MQFTVRDGFRPLSTSSTLTSIPSVATSVDSDQNRLTDASASSTSSLSRCRILLLVSIVFVCGIWFGLLVASRAQESEWSSFVPESLPLLTLRSDHAEAASNRNPTHSAALMTSNHDENNLRPTIATSLSVLPANAATAEELLLAIRNLTHQIQQLQRKLSVSDSTEGKSLSSAIVESESNPPAVLSLQNPEPLTAPLQPLSMPILRPSVHAARLATLFELLSAGVGIQVGLTGGSISNRAGSPKAGHRFETPANYAEIFVAWLNEQWPVKDSELNRQHRNLTEHTLWSRSLSGTTSAWSSQCLFSQFIVDADSESFSSPDPMRRNQSDPRPFDHFYPERMPDLLLIEYAVNDVAYVGTPTSDLFSFTPGANVERIFRQVLSNPHLHTAILLVEFAAVFGTATGLGKSAEDEHAPVAQHYDVPYVSYRNLLRNELFDLPPEQQKFVFGSARFPILQWRAPLNGFLNRFHVHYSNISDTEFGAQSWDATHPNHCGHSLMSIYMQKEMMRLQRNYERSGRKSFASLDGSEMERQWILSSREPILKQSSPFQGAANSGPYAEYELPEPLFARNALIDFHTSSPIDASSPENTSPFPSCRLLIIPMIDIRTSLAPFLGVQSAMNWTTGLVHSRQWMKYSYRPATATSIDLMKGKEKEVQPATSPSEGLLTMKLVRGPAHSMLSVSFIRSREENMLGDAVAWLSCEAHYTAPPSISDTSSTCIDRTLEVRLHSNWTMPATQTAMQTIWASRDYMGKVRQLASANRTLPTSDREWLKEVAYVLPEWYQAQDAVESSKGYKRCCNSFAYLHVRLVSEGAFYFTGYTYS